MSFFKSQYSLPIFLNGNMKEDIEMIQPVQFDENKYMVIVDDSSTKGKINLSIYLVLDEFTKVSLIMKLDNPHVYPLRSMTFL